MATRRRCAARARRRLVARPREGVVLGDAARARARRRDRAVRPAADELRRRREAAARRRVARHAPALELGRDRVLEAVARGVELGARVGELAKVGEEGRLLGRAASSTSASERPPRGLAPVSATSSASRISTARGGERAAARGRRRTCAGRRRARRAPPRSGATAIWSCDQPATPPAPRPRAAAVERRLHGRLRRRAHVVELGAHAARSTSAARAPPGARPSRARRERRPRRGARSRPLSASRSAIIDAEQRLETPCARRTCAGGGRACERSERVDVRRGGGGATTRAGRPPGGAAPSGPSTERVGAPRTRSPRLSANSCTPRPPPPRARTGPARAASSHLAELASPTRAPRAASVARARRPTGLAERRARSATSRRRACRASARVRLAWG